PFNFVRGARGSIRGGLNGAGKLNGSQTHTAAHGMDQDVFTGTQVSLNPESVMRGDKDFWHCGGLDPIKIGRNLRQQMLMGNNVFRMSAPAEQAEDALAGLPSANR